MEIHENMEFKLTQKFIPNFCNASSLKIVNVNDTTVRIEMENARSRGVFPRMQFMSLIRNGALVYSDTSSNEDTA